MTTTGQHGERSWPVCDDPDDIRRRPEASSDLWRVVLVLLAGAALAGCGGADDAGAVRIGMLDNVFTRDVTRVPAGADVVFRNLGKTVHNAVAVDGSWSTADSYGADVLPTGASTTIAVERPGV